MTKKAFRILAGLSILFLSTFSGPIFCHDQQMLVMTYNIHHGEGTDHVIDLERLARIIKKYDPDLVALQEVDKVTERSLGVDQLAELGRITQMETKFGKAIDYKGGAYGQGILSRHPILAHQVYELPGDPNIETRIVMESTIDLPDKTRIRFATTHLHYIQDSKDRLLQAAAINDIYRKSEVPVILAGDLNAVPESETLQILDELWIQSSGSGGGLTYPSWDPDRKIDYILIRRQDHWNVVKTRIVGGNLAEKASDHLPLLAELLY